VQFTGTIMNLMAVSLVVMEGYSSKFIIFTEATPSTKMKILFGTISN